MCIYIYVYIYICLEIQRADDKSGRSWPVIHQASFGFGHALGTHPDNSKQGGAHVCLSGWFLRIDGDSIPICQPWCRNIDLHDWVMNMG